MRFFTYSRKSVFRDNSDSVQNQSRMCREYCDLHFAGQIDSWAEYCDEDYSGANTDRPDYQRMMSDIGSGLCDILVVYQLDRFSRSVRDFSAAYEFLEAHHVRFICLDMNIDTSTPIGEAMMYVSAAFGQMERKNIASRVTDNLRGLAKKGYWTGGTPPFGYSIAKTVIDGRKHSILVPSDPEAVNDIYDTYLRLDRTMKATQENFNATVSRVLRDPTYCQATPEVREYLISQGCQIDEGNWDGAHGIIIHSRLNRTGKRQITRSRSEWIVAVGCHEPIVSADKWLRTQQMIDSHSRIYKPKYPPPLLMHVLKCKCGYTMVRQPVKYNGRMIEYYSCANRRTHGKEACDMPYVQTHLIDDAALRVFKEISLDDNAIKKYVDAPAQPRSTSKLDKAIKSTQKKLDRLSASLSLAADTSAAKYIIKELEKEDEVLSKLKAEKLQIESENKKCNTKNIDIKQKTKEIKEMISDFDNFDAYEKNEIARKLLKSATWDGSTLFLSFL